MDFYIESSSGVGEIDLIEAQVGPNRLVADAKVFNFDKKLGKRYIIDGFHQMCAYLSHYHEKIGHLVIFNVCDRELSLGTPDQLNGFPCVAHNGKTVVFVIIDLFGRPSASKRGAPKRCDISREEFIAAKMDTAPQG